MGASAKPHRIGPVYERSQQGNQRILADGAQAHRRQPAHVTALVLQGRYKVRVCSVVTDVAQCLCRFPPHVIFWIIRQWDQSTHCRLSHGRQCLARLLTYTLIPAAEIGKTGFELRWRPAGTRRPLPFLGLCHQSLRQNDIEDAMMHAAPGTHAIPSSSGMFWASGSWARRTSSYAMSGAAPSLNRARASGPVASGPAPWRACYNMLRPQLPYESTCVLSCPQMDIAPARLTRRGDWLSVQGDVAYVLGVEKYEAAVCRASPYALGLRGGLWLAPRAGDQPSNGPAGSWQADATGPRMRGIKSWVATRLTPAISGAAR